MSIKSLMKGNKSWLNIKANTVDSITTNITSGDILDIPSGSNITLSGISPVDGQIIMKTGSNVSWNSGELFGEGFETFADATTFNTTSLTFVSVTGSSAAFTGIATGNYVLFYDIQLQNTTTDGCSLQIIDTDTLEVLNTWNYITAITPNQFRTASGFKLYNNISGTKNLEAQMLSHTGLQVGSRGIRWILFRIS